MARKKKKTNMRNILANQEEINWFAVNSYHNDGKGHPISRLNFSGSARAIGFVFLVIGVALAILGFAHVSTGGVFFIMLGVGALWIAVDNLRYKPRYKRKK